MAASIGSSTGASAAIRGEASSVSLMRGRKDAVRRGSLARVCDGEKADVVAIANVKVRIAVTMKTLGVILCGNCLRLRWLTGRRRRSVTEVWKL